jgi:hypothetical protein
MLQTGQVGDIESARIYLNTGWHSIETALQIQVQLKHWNSQSLYPVCLFSRSVVILACSDKVRCFNTSRFFAARLYPSLVCRTRAVLIILEYNCWLVFSLFGICPFWINTPILLILLCLWPDQNCFCRVCLVHLLPCLAALSLAFQPALPGRGLILSPLNLPRLMVYCWRHFIVFCFFSFYAFVLS